MKILMTGLSRSGNHPILHWLMAHFEGEFVHYNAVLAGSKNIRTRKSQIRLWRKGKEVGGKELKEFIDHIISGGKEPENVVVSCENTTAGEAERIYYEYYDEEPDLQIIVLRSYLNVMASRLKKSQNVSGVGLAWFKTGNREICMWCNHANNYLLKTSWSVIKYDTWCTGYRYRRILEKKLELRNGIDGDMDYVPRDANGSSFDGRKDQSGLELAIKSKDRYKEVRLSCEIRKNKEALELSKEIFG